MKINCPYAYKNNGIIMCRKTENACGNVKYCRMKGRWELLESSVSCPIKAKGDNKNGQK